LNTKRSFFLFQRARGAAHTCHRNKKNVKDLERELRNMHHGNIDSAEQI